MPNVILPLVRRNKPLNNHLFNLNDAILMLIEGTYYVGAITSINMEHNYWFYNIHIAGEDIKMSEYDLSKIMTPTNDIDKYLV